MADELHLYRQAIQEAQAIAKAYPLLRNGGERLQNYLQDINMPAKNYRSLKEDLEPVAIRLPLSIIDYIDNSILPTLQAQTPWAKVGRSDAVRYLVQIGIDAGFAAEAPPAPAATTAAMPPATTAAAQAPAAATLEPAAAAVEPAAAAVEPAAVPAQATKTCHKGHTYDAARDRCPECKRLSDQERRRRSKGAAAAG